MEAEGMFQFPVGVQAGVGVSDPAGENDEEPPSSLPAATTAIPFFLDTGLPVVENYGHAPSCRKRFRSGSPATKEFRRKVFPIRRRQ